MMLAYPVVTSGPLAHRGSFRCLLGERADDGELLERLSIERHIDAKTPPVFVWHTMTDTSVPVENTLMLIQACRAAGVSVEAHLFPEGSHGLSLGDEETAGASRYAHVVECVQSWPQLAGAWLRRICGFVTVVLCAGHCVPLFCVLHRIGPDLWWAWRHAPSIRH